MDHRAIYTGNRRPSSGKRRSSSHISRRGDASDFAANDSHRTLAVRPRYPDQQRKSGYEAGLRGGSVIYCGPQPARAGGRHQGAAVAASYALDPHFAGGFVDDLPAAARRAAAAEVYEVPLSPYAASDFDGSRSRSSSSARTSRPSSRGSEYVYTEYEDDEERERKRFLGTELYGYVMALRLKERLVDVRQVLNLYKDFDRVSGGELLLSLMMSPEEALSPGVGRHFLFTQGMHLKDQR